ncbi:membrane-bound PQQ-dependent dehydrogenase, glucose/quinate/shikimate family [Pseudomonas syringae pv. syringae]|uniref:membrane-bound PQQ-dependent dehydrogenase, glucose/quinate/shikimate family n=1 Tax=Pseudomonas syringae TaxID=317 RepID=UPI0023F95A31|nr:membrane-bound PQQ-dependent dehydrogenase, glucose/quinate/shikimate family [Pseudomonas syringae]MDF5890341.1 membrane-bound PQQ-dependent dehydrogenase, glucose/quinate/shikimate family [Pseudomonas syringae pv. syringae]
MEQSRKSRTARVALAALGVVILLVGLFMLGGGSYLISLGGSWYFAAAGVGLTAAGVLLARRRTLGAALYLLVFVATIGWSLWDVGLAFWPLFSRLYALAVLTFLVLLALPMLGRGERRPIRSRLSYAGAAVMAVALIATFYATLQPQPIQTADGALPPAPGHAVGAVEGSDWRAFGRTPSGTRHAVANQITPANVAGLKVAWTYRTGEIPNGPSQGHVVTPLNINGVLYGCTQSSQLFALDADTGKELWRFDSHSKINNVYPRCRGVGYHDATASAASANTPADSSAGPAACTRRIISTTVDARLIAVDAATGKACTDFGDGGSVNLHVGMGKDNQDLYFPTAAPTVVRDLVVIGGLVWDNQKTGEPSGVVRAFDVRTGALVWAWDLGNPAITKLPPEGESYTTGTPNVWSTPSFDDKLGLIYLPTGNATPDFWGGQRTEADDRYSSSIVALDISTGRERWHFQTVHHDLWDYDVPSQPALYDVPDGHGGTLPALIQTTKRGQIFMLDRRTGTPIADVQERPVPQGGVGDDRLAPTQPYSVGMPSIGTEPLSEKRMWGLTPLDQLVCRIDFRKSRYEGEFTPPSERRTIQYPSWLGGMNWGSVSIAENLGYMIVNDTRVPIWNRMIPRAAYDEKKLTGGGHEGNAPQDGTPWGIEQGRFLSPLGVPCQEPPYGTISAIDLATRKVVWSMPLGTTQETGPLGIATHLPIPIGMPTRGGPVTTSSGLVFMAGTQDFNIRAFDVRTGHELWKGDLPVGAEATPMTYVSPRTGRQFVVISAGGNSATTQKGDYIIAFALPL